MPIDIANGWQFFAVALSSILFLVDPVATIPAFLVMTDGRTQAQRRRMAKRASWTCFFVLCGFGLIGAQLFQLLGITMPAFRIAGGLILLLIGLDMVQAKRPTTSEAPGEAEEGANKEDASIIPLGMPMLAGPGAISTVMVLIGPRPVWWQLVLIIVAVAVTAALSFWVLKAADGVRRYLGETGIHILTRLMGMLLTALAVQFISGGLLDLGFGVKR